MRNLTAALAGAAVALTLTAGSWVAGAQVARHPESHPFRENHEPFWTQRNCRNADDMNCFARDPGDGGSHPHFRELLGGRANGLLCVHFAGTKRYAVHHDYCLIR